jgi:hypothetical protein
MILSVRITPHFIANEAAGDGVTRVSFDLDEPAVFDNGKQSARVRTI